jgi:hypothetical protein
MNSIRLHLTRQTLEKVGRYDVLGNNMYYCISIVWDI